MTSTELSELPKTPQSGDPKQVAKDLFSGACGGIAQVLIGESVVGMKKLTLQCMTGIIARLQISLRSSERLDIPASPSRTTLLT